MSVQLVFPPSNSVFEIHICVCIAGRIVGFMTNGERVIMTLTKVRWLPSVGRGLSPKCTTDAQPVMSSFQNI